jgi:hypothetical protein
MRIYAWKAEDLFDKNTEYSDVEMIDSMSDLKRQIARLCVNPDTVKIVKIGDFNLCEWEAQSGHNSKWKKFNIKL